MLETLCVKLYNTCFGAMVKFYSVANIITPYNVALQKARKVHYEIVAFWAKCAKRVQEHIQQHNTKTSS